MKKTMALAMAFLLTLTCALAEGNPPEGMPDGTPPADMGEPPEGMGEPPEGMGEPPEGMGEPPEGMGEMPGGMPGGASAPESWAAATEITQDTDSTDGIYTSTGTDENAVLVSCGATARLIDAIISRVSEGSTGGDSSSFYGIGAAALVTDGTLYIENGGIATESAGGAGVFAYLGGVAYVKDTSVSTEKDTSGGLHVAGGGTLYAYDCAVETDGMSSAAIRSDRGGGTMVIDGGTYTSNGTGSPAIYCTADISVNNAALTATSSEALCLEGLNSVRLFDSTLSGNMADDSQNDNTWTVILYQSMSGDAQDGRGEFQMTGGSLISENGGVFYTTNTESSFILSGVDIQTSDDSEYILRCTGNSNERGWGAAGENGADCDFTAISQSLNGDVIWDSISKLDMYLTSGSALTGAITDDETNAGNGGDGYCALYIDSASKWVVTGDSALTSLHNEGAIVDEQGNNVSLIGSDGSVIIEGESEYSVTVSEYAENCDGASPETPDTWEAHEVAFN